MIRKPDAAEFRESAAVLHLRDAGTVAVEGVRGVGQGTAQFVGRGLTVLFCLGFVLSVGRHFGSFSLLVGGAGLLALFLRSGGGGGGGSRSAGEMRWAGPAGVVGAEADPAGTQRYELSVARAARSAAKTGVIAVLLFPTKTLFYMLPFGFGSIAALTLSFLTLARLTGDRTVLRFDAQSLTVDGLRGRATILWADVDDIAVCKARFFDLKVLFATGARRNLVLSGDRNRLGGPARLLVPIDLLGLDGDVLAGLVARLIALQRGARHAELPRADKLRSDMPRADMPRMAARARPAPPAAPAATAYDDGFDPDAIIARHLAAREAQAAADRAAQAAQAGRAMPARPAFGRKRA